MLGLTFLGLCLACGLTGAYILAASQIEMRRTN